jgi:intracellular septation protein
VKDVLQRLVGDFLSTIIFVAVMLISGSVLLATAVAIAGAVAQIAWARARGQQLGTMTWMSLALVIVLGTATLITNDPRFVLIKPSIAHFAIGAIMFRRGWMSRYMPEIVMQNAPELPVIAGYLWAGLMILLGIGTVVLAWFGDTWSWTIYVSIIAPLAKVVAIAVQFVAFRVILGRRIRAARKAGAQPEPAALP